MPIGAVAGISAAGALGSAAISSSASSKASDAASQAAAANNALQSQIYASNTANLKPFMTRGNEAGDEINSLLGLGDQTPTLNADAYLAANPDVQAFYNSGQAIDPSTGKAFTSPEAFAQWHYANDGQQEGRAEPTTTPGQSGLNTFLNSTDYNFTTQQGLDALDQSRVAAAGGLHSGATLKAISNYGQNTAQSALNSYLGYLSGQQSTGLSGANALAGVGTGYAGAVSANNNSAASATGNAALASANTTAGALNGVGSTLGTLYGASSYGGGYGALSGVGANGTSAGISPIADGLI